MRLEMDTITEIRVGEKDETGKQTEMDEISALNFRLVAVK